MRGDAAHGSSGAAHIEDLIQRLAPGTPVIPPVEAAAGVLTVVEVCAAPEVVRPAFGCLDLAALLLISVAGRAGGPAPFVLAAAAAGLCRSAWTASQRSTTSRP